MRVGFHLPISKGFEYTAREARRLGCEVVQIFVKNPRSWAYKTLSDKDRSSFAQWLSDFPVVAHLSYLPNIARADEDPRNKDALLHEAGLCEELGIRNLVVHCGSHEDTEKGIERAARSVGETLERFDLSILLEVSAGQGNSIGKDVSQLAALHRLIADGEKTGFCLDTAHLFQAGYDVRKKSAWKALIGELESTCGKGCIKFFHLNDSRSSLGSRVDRHWHIGKGEIGLRCFRFLLKEKNFAHLGGVMETPKMGNMDEENMKIMRSLLPSLVSGPFS